MSFRRVFALSLLIAAGVGAGAGTDAAGQGDAAGRLAARADAAGRGKPQPAPSAGTILGDAKAGEGKATACGACHGMDGNSADKQYPKLAGQNEAYIARQLTLFKTQKRQNPIMMGFAANALGRRTCTTSARISRQESLPGVADEKLLERGQALYRGGERRSACRPAWRATVRTAAAWPAPAIRSSPASGPTTCRPSSRTGRAAPPGAMTPTRRSCRRSRSASATTTSRRWLRTSKACTPRRRRRQQRAPTKSRGSSPPAETPRARRAPSRSVLRCERRLSEVPC